MEAKTNIFKMGCLDSVKISNMHSSISKNSQCNALSKKRKGGGGDCFLRSKYLALSDESQHYTNIICRVGKKRGREKLKGLI